MGSTLEYQTQEQAPTNLNTLFPHVWVLLYVSLVFLTLAGEVWVLRETLGGERLFSEFPKSALMTRESVMEDEKLCDAVNRHSSLSPAQTSRWHPYLVHMPQTYDILAMFGEFEKRALQVQFLLDYGILSNDIY
ncbi:Protein SET DOMAIN GROUP 40 [Glycine max]|nr:Protein SET DOMAIN GROUP 40 [Glycine max]